MDKSQRKELNNYIQLAKTGRKIAIMCSDEIYNILRDYIHNYSNLVCVDRIGYYKEACGGINGFIQLISPNLFDEVVGKEKYDIIWFHRSSCFTNEQIAKIHGFARKIDKNTDSENEVIQVNEVAQSRDFLVFTICRGYSSVPGNISDACILKGITEKEAAEKMGNNLLRRSNLNEPVHICVVDGSIPINMRDIATMRTLSGLKGKMKFFTIKPLESFEIEEGSVHSF
jgi:hypothetical protein